MNNALFFLWQEPAPPTGGMGGYMNIIFIVVAIGIIYFLMIRPQSQQRKKQSSFASSLKKGTKVVTMAGVHGTISDVTDTTVDLIIAPKTIITVNREAISMDYTKAAYGESDESTKKEK